ncbi:RrF2 family transcriptional regulator [Bacillus horti]|uniref:Rrf2 family protein n=1 Tax=Caldalkalibacillus horti TaxID=77523 RepID=A0ABT9VWR2_9BACI|nr:Rrf2 family transcriptional regulator [Bacillus horti]MDQ0165319.1 Rrf2 family protein [Bacillus horti]
MVKKSASAIPDKTFGVAVQALVVLSLRSDTCPSCDIAAYMQSEATQLRRILAKLVRSGLLVTREGRDGGYRLKQSPDSFTLADVYMALQTEEDRLCHLSESTGSNPFGQQMSHAFTELKVELEQSALQVLRQYTLADFAERIKKTLNH